MPDEITDKMRMDELEKLASKRVPGGWEVRHTMTFPTFKAPTLRGAVDKAITYYREHDRTEAELEFIDTCGGLRPKVNS